MQCLHAPSSSDGAICNRFLYISVQFCILSVYWRSYMCSTGAVRSILSLQSRFIIEGVSPFYACVEVGEPGAVTTLGKEFL